ncbi:DUF5339 family protein [Pasteurellaceae bacterium 22721_9_1]
MKKVLFGSALFAMAFAANAADLHPKCDEYFKAVDAYVEKAPEAVKQQMNASKEQMKMAPAAAQEQTCAMALEQLKKMPKM